MRNVTEKTGLNFNIFNLYRKVFLNTANSYCVFSLISAHNINEKVMVYGHVFRLLPQVKTAEKIIIAVS